MTVCNTLNPSAGGQVVPTAITYGGKTPIRLEATITIGSGDFNANTASGSIFNGDEESDTPMTTHQEKTYEAVEAQQLRYCNELNENCMLLDPNSRVGFALETQNRVPINGLRHPPEGNMNGWYLWCGEQFL